MRSLALAEANVLRGGRSIFVMANGKEMMAPRLSLAGVALEMIDLSDDVGSVADADATLAIARTSNADWIITDGYTLKGEYLKRLRHGHDNLLSIDDWGLGRPHFAKVIIDANVAANAADYASATADTELLLGSDYVLLRDEFTREGGTTACSAQPHAKHLLVTFGASDPSGMTAKVVAALSDRPGDDWRAKVIVGPANPDFAEITAIAGHRTQIELLQKARMVDVMTWADLAVSAGGTTLWELAYCGTPVIGVAAADNQVPNIDRMSALGLIKSLGWHASVDSSQIRAAIDVIARDAAMRAEMTLGLKALVDGQGVRRVFGKMAHAANP